MNAIELAKYLDRLNGYMDMPRDILDITQASAIMLRQQADRIAELENPLLLAISATFNQKELSDEEILEFAFKHHIAVSKDTDVFLLEHNIEDLINFARAIIKEITE